jgi:phage portal protein BeeE
LTTDEFDAGYYTKHDFRPILLKLAKDRADYYRKLWEIGVYTVNEIRELEGLNPIDDSEGGNLRFRPQNEAGLTDPATKPEENKPSDGSEPTQEEKPRGLMEILGGRQNGRK